MLVEQHTHAVDLMRVLCGEIESAYAVGATNLLADTPNLTIYDCNACTVRFANGRAWHYRQLVRGAGGWRGLSAAHGAGGGARYGAERQ
ncbi:MAG: hypothetical protein R2911_34720 [Caldilineaceae bacterium]